MDMLSYFLGRLAGGGSGGTDIQEKLYDKIEYCEGDIIKFYSEENIYEMKCSYTDSKITQITFQGETFEIRYENDMTYINDTEVNLVSAPVTPGSGEGGSATYDETTGIVSFSGSISDEEVVIL